jgi:hemerythrin-like domain-containing protein
MWEHRLIESMVHVIEDELLRIREEMIINSPLIDAVIDFFRIYADRTHHGKEEDILFRRLEEKDLTEGFRSIMNGLLEDHVKARETVSAIAVLHNRYKEGDDGSRDDILERLRDITELYPRHIETEDKEFFYPCMDYFTEEEQNGMLDEFREFDREMIHEKYRNVVETFGGKVLKK